MIIDLAAENSISGNLSFNQKRKKVWEEMNG